MARPYYFDDSGDIPDSDMRLGGYVEYPDSSASDIVDVEYHNAMVSVAPGYSPICGGAPFNTIPMANASPLVDMNKYIPPEYSEDNMFNAGVALKPSGFSGDRYLYSAGMIEVNKDTDDAYDYSNVVDFVEYCVSRRLMPFNNILDTDGEDKVHLLFRDSHCTSDRIRHLIYSLVSMSFDR